MKALPTIAGIVGALLVAGVGGMYLLRNTAPSSEITVPVSLFGTKNPVPSSAPSFYIEPETTSEAEQSDRIVPTGHREYRNTELRFGLVAEEGARVTEFSEGNGAYSITIEDEARGHALQMYVLPYGGSTIGEDRFRLDLPSGVRTNEEMITIDGVPAVAFISEISALGKTREVWLLYGGRLYEFSVPLAMEAWFRELLPTVRFYNI